MYHTVNKYDVNQMFFMQEKKQPIPRKDKNIISIQSHTVAYEQAFPQAKFFPGGGTLGISGWGCAAGTLEPLTYTRASSAEFCYPILK